MNKIYWDNERKINGCEKLSISTGQWAYIKRIGTILNRLYTNDCNGFQDANGNWDEKSERRNAGHVKHAESLVYMFAGHNGLYVYLQTDPRGACIYLDKQPIPENNYTRAVCIY